MNHVILEEGIVVDLENIESIMDWATPKVTIYIISFMGLAGYFRRFIEGFSKIVHLITSL